MNQQEVQEAVNAFNAANQAERDALAKREDLKIDAAIAAREGDPVAVEQTHKLEEEALHEWAKLYRARNDAALALCRAIGVECAALKRALG